MEKYQIQNGGFFFEISLSFIENLKTIFLQGKININDNIYTLYISLKELQNNYEYFQICNSIKQAFQLFSNCFRHRKVFIKEINNSGIILGIQTERNEEIFFNLISNSFNMINQNNINYMNNVGLNGGIFSYHNNFNNNRMDQMNKNMDNNQIYNQMNNNYINYNNNLMMNNNQNNNNNFLMNNQNYYEFNQNNNNNIMNNQNNHEFSQNNNNNIMNNQNNHEFNQNNNNNNQMSKNNYSIYSEPNNENDNKSDNENNSSIFISIFEGENNNLNQKKEDLNDLLKIRLIKKLINYFDNKDINGFPNNLKDVFLKIKNNVHFTGDNNLELMINENRIINILLFSQYLKNLIIDSNLLNQKINQFLSMQQKSEIDNFWRSLSKYEKYNSFFKFQFIKDLKRCKCDYSIISFNILNSDIFEEYEKKKEECPNINKKLLYTNSQINPFSQKVNYKLEYSKRKCYGNGFYFLDSIDCLPSYCDKEINDFNYQQISVNSIFTLIVSEIFYDNTKLQEYEDIKLSKKELNNLNLKDKNAEKNGIIQIKIKNNNPISINNSASQNNIKNDCLCNEYVISEPYQILPLYTITLRRNEYCVLWRDPNFKGNNEYSNFLQKVKLLCIEKTNMNFYYETSTEEALKFILRRKYDKVIIITSIGRDLSGKRFVEIARKIFGFDVMVLFFSNNQKHLNWIKNFKNCLYTNKSDIYEQYITNFNESSLKQLKRKVEQDYNIELLPFSFDFISYYNHRNEGDFNTLDYRCPYIRHVNIKNGNNYLYMKFDGEVILSKESCSWDVTVYDNKITMFSNGLYLDLSENMENVIGFEYMKIWNFEIIDGYFCFINNTKIKNNILSIENGEVKVNKEIVGSNEIFELIDIIEE